MDYLNKSKGFAQNVWKGESAVASVIKVLVLVVLIMFLVNVSKRVYKGYKKYTEGNILGGVDGPKVIALPLRPALVCFFLF